MIPALKQTVVVLTLAVAFLALPDSSATAQKEDIEILKAALKKTLGERTNTGHYRVVLIRKGLKKGKPALSISLNANNSPTSAGMRYGIFADVLKTFRVLQSWDWPSKVTYVLVGEYARVKVGNREAVPQLLFATLISSDKIRETDWDSFDPRKIPEIVDMIQLHESIKG
jgi:hypothetical protein